MVTVVEFHFKVELVITKTKIDKLSFSIATIYK